MTESQILARIQFLETEIERVRATHPPDSAKTVISDLNRTINELSEKLDLPF